MWKKHVQKTKPRLKSEGARSRLACRARNCGILRTVKPYVSVADLLFYVFIHHFYILNLTCKVYAIAPTPIIHLVLISILESLQLSILKITVQQKIMWDFKRKKLGYIKTNPSCASVIILFFLCYC